MGFYDFLIKEYLASLSSRGTGILYMEAHSIFEVSMEYLLIIGRKEDFRGNHPGMMAEHPLRSMKIIWLRLFSFV